VIQDIKPCPFCGHVGLHFIDGSTYRWGLASCGACGATAGEVRRNYPDDGNWHAEAIREWNTRAQAPAAEPLTDDQVWASWLCMPVAADGENDSMEARIVRFARAIERAHGIGALAPTAKEQP